MTENRKNEKKRFNIKNHAAQTVFAILSLLLIPVYTLIFGLKENPWEYTLSNIGNFFDNRLSFILWGIATGMAILYYTIYIFERMDFMHRNARRYMVASQVFLVLTVLTPALKVSLPFWHFMHVIWAGFFALFLVISLLLFIKFLAKNNQRLSKRVLALLMSCVGVSILALFFMGLNGVVEMLFFIGIFIFLTVLTFILNKFRKDKDRVEQQKTYKKAIKKHPGQ